MSESFVVPQMPLSSRRTSVTQKLARILEAAWYFLCQYITKNELCYLPLCVDQTFVLVSFSGYCILIEADCYKLPVSVLDTAVLTTLQMYSFIKWSSDRNFMCFAIIRDPS